MKKRLMTVILMLITCAALALGFAACGNDNADVPADGNMAKVVLREYEGDSGKEFVGYYSSKGSSVFGWGCEYLDYSIDDIIGLNLPYSNYASIRFRWKTGGYKITKVEFDLSAESSYKTTLKLANPNDIAEFTVNIAAGQTKHISFDINLTDNNYIFTVKFGAEADTVMRLVNTKISNFYVTAEKV